MGLVRSLVIFHFRAISMMWIINGHITFYSLPSMDNPAMILPFMTQILMQPVFVSTSVVDTFFALSGFLLAFHFQQKRGNRVIYALKAILGRFLKFTPSYAITILLVIVVSAYIEDVSPYWPLEAQQSNCRQFWWRNLLYINNYFPMSDMCMSWTWYLSVDFQCFILGIVLLTLYPR